MRRVLKGRRDRGAVMMLFSILLSSGVVLGMCALSVDLGNVMQERRELQNGADAASLALASACANGTSECASAATAATSFKPLAGQNAADKLADITSDNVCGFAVATLPGCASAGSYSNFTDCTPLPSWAAGAKHYVQVRTTSLSTAGTILPSIFARALAGGYTGQTYAACARAAWGPAGSTGNTLPITIGACDWANATQVGGVAGKKYAPSPPYSPSPGTSTTPMPSAITDGGYATGIFTHDSADHKCSGSPGDTYPGGFSWLDSTACVATIDAGGWVAGSTGNGNQCTAADLKKYIGTEVFIPIYDQYVGNGAGGTYHVRGVASFFFAGWNGMSTAAPEKSYSVYQQPASVCTGKCNDSVSYIWGWFTSDEKSLDSVTFGGEDMGASVIAPAG